MNEVRRSTGRKFTCCSWTCEAVSNGTHSDLDVRSPSPFFVAEECCRSVVRREREGRGMQKVEWKREMVMEREREEWKKKEGETSGLVRREFRNWGIGTPWTQPAVLLQCL